MLQTSHQLKHRQSFNRNQKLNKQQVAEAKTMIVLGKWNKGLTRFLRILNRKPRATFSQKPQPISIERRSLQPNISSRRSTIECSHIVRTQMSKKIAMTWLIWSLGLMFLANVKKNRQSPKNKVLRQREARPTSWCDNQTQPLLYSRPQWTS